eukprot:g18752.t1
MVQGLEAAKSQKMLILRPGKAESSKAGVRTAVVMFDLEVTWPPPSTHSRVGGYEFLGGEAEAVLLISRAFGKFDFAIKEPQSGMFALFFF